MPVIQSGYTPLCEISPKIPRGAGGWNSQTRPWSSFDVRVSRFTPDSRGGQGKLAADSFVIAVCRPKDREPDESFDDRHALVLRTRPPVGEEGEEVGHANVVVAVEVGGAAFARAPIYEQ